MSGADDARGGVVDSANSSSGSSATAGTGTMEATEATEATNDNAATVVSTGEPRAEAPAAEKARKPRRDDAAQRAGPWIPERWTLQPAFAIAGREITSYFFSPIAYVAMTLFLLASGFVFWDDFQPGKPADMRNTFEWMLWLLVFVVPVLTMGLLAQERATGTFETLMTAAVTETEVVIGKFLGSLAFLCVLIAPTLVYVVMLAAYGEPDAGPLISGYLGILLTAALFISIGLLCSSLATVQLIAAVVSAAVLFAVTIVPWWVAGQTRLPGPVKTLMNQAVFTRYTDFSRGVIDTGNIVFFAVATAVCLFLTVKVLESRRWK